MEKEILIKEFNTFISNEIKTYLSYFLDVDKELKKELKTPVDTVDYFIAESPQFHYLYKTLYYNLIDFACENSSIKDLNKDFKDYCFEDNGDYLVSRLDYNSLTIPDALNELLYSKCLAFREWGEDGFNRFNISYSFLIKTINIIKDSR